MDAALRVLVVGVGNEFRSPLAERCLRHQLALLLGPDQGAIEVGSAGVSAVRGVPMSEAAAVELARLGVSSAGFRTRSLDGAMLREADVVLTVTRALRSKVRLEEPEALRRTFTFRELAVLARLLPPPVSPAQFLAESAAHRWAVGVAQRDLEPLSSGMPRRQRQVADQVWAASRALAGVLARMPVVAG